MLPFLIPLFAGLSALGALSGGAASIARAANDAKDAKNKLEESKRHNKKMEAIAVGKSGSGLYLKPYKEGLGLYLIYLSLRKVFIWKKVLKANKNTKSPTKENKDFLSSLG